MPPHRRRLPDRIAPGVRVLFVGINPGLRSAETGHHFAGYSNRFWKLLHESGLVPEPIGHVDDHRLPEWGYGITNLVPRPTSGIGELRPTEYRAGRRALLRKIARVKPELVALVGVTLYRAIVPRSRDNPRAAPVTLGPQPERIHGARVFVLPNPSGRNAHFSYADMLAAFRALRRALGRDVNAQGARSSLARREGDIRTDPYLSRRFMMSDSTVRGRFVWHELLTTDTKSAAGFYAKVAGWKTQAWDKDPSYTLFTMGGPPMGGLMTLPAEAKAMGAPPNWLSHIGTLDVDDTARLAVSLGGKILKPAESIPTVGRFAVLQDPHGAVFSVYAPDQQPQPEGVPALGDFSWHELATTDWRAALSFYQRLFGWEESTAMDMGPELGVYQMYGRNGKMLGGMYNKPRQIPGPPFWLPYIKVPDAKKAAAVAQKQGGRIVNGPMEVPGGDWIAVGMDLQGAAFAVHSAKPAAAAEPAAPKPPAAAKSKPKAKASAKPKAKAKSKARPKAKAKARPAKKAAKKRAAARKRSRAKGRRR